MKNTINKTKTTQLHQNDGGCNPANSCAVTCKWNLLKTIS